MKLLRIISMLFLSLMMIQCDKDSGTAPDEQPVSPVMIEFLGHSSFLIVTPDSLRIVTDPVGSSVPQYYTAPDSLFADLITVSHSHGDHAQTSTIQGDPNIIRTAICDTIGSVIIQGYLSEHGDWGDTVMGSNIIFVFKIGDVKVVHLGENRNVTEPEILSAISDADVLIAPTGQIASISFEELNILVTDNEIHTVIPSHYSLNADSRYYESSTTDEYVEALPTGTVVVYQDSLEVVPDMPEQVVVMQALYSKL